MVAKYPLLHSPALWAHVVTRVNSYILLLVRNSQPRAVASCGAPLSLHKCPSWIIVWPPHTPFVVVIPHNGQNRHLDLQWCALGHGAPLPRAQMAILGQIGQKKRAKKGK